MIGAIEFEETQTDDGMLEITLRGRPEELIAVLVKGLPIEALKQFGEALGRELGPREGDTSNAD